MDDFNRALIFKSVVEQGSMAAAARFMNVSPSVVTKRIAELEQSLGVQLLRRTTRRISVTEAGDNFYNRMTYLHGQWQSLLDETESLGQEPKGVLSIAAPPPVLNRVLVPVLDGFLDQYQKIEIELQSVSYEELPRAAADLSLARKLDSFDSGAFIGRSLCRYHNQLFVSPDYIVQMGVPKQLSDLADHACLVFESQSHEAKWCFEQGQEVSVHGRLVSNNTEALIAAALRGQGIAYIPEIIIRDEVQRGDLVPVLGELSSRSFEMWAYYQQLDFVPLKLRALLEYLARQWK